MAESLSTLQLAVLAQQAQEQRRLLAAEPLAIVGIGCRLPAGAGQPDLETPEAYWQFLEAGGCAIRDVPEDRWVWQRYRSKQGGKSGGICSRRGAFLKAIDAFEPGFFGISPREARAMDPQHRLLLEVSQEALERAGYGAGQLNGSRTGVFMGLCTTDYAWRQLQGGNSDLDFDLYFATGNGFSVAVGRIAHVLGLQGPALAVDTACSSSLVAVDLACRSLRDRSCDVALAGGVSVLLSPVNSLCFSRSGMMAPDGLCKTFDARADGYGRGEGCGVVVIKRLADALAAGDPLWAVIRGSGVNQDGASAGLTVPNGAAQADLIVRTLEQAALKPHQIQVLEAHGTGTPLGDPIELQAAAQVYGQPGRAESLRVGSAKANLGHLEAAAGIAGLIKGVLMVKHGWIPPNPHLQKPTLQFNWQAWALQPVRQGEPWPNAIDGRRVAVSSFGFSGTNAHVVVEQAPALNTTWPEPGKPDWLLLAARSEQALQELVRRYQQWLPQQPEAAWCAICAAARRALRPWSWRLAVQSCSAAEASRSLETVGFIECVPNPGLLAFQLEATSEVGELERWRQFGLQPTALIHGPGQEALARELAGTPTSLRLISEQDAALRLERLGYPEPVLLLEPTPQRLVELWLAGHTIQWKLLEPVAPWPRPVLPTTPFARQRCWLEGLREDPPGEVSSVRPRLEHQPAWHQLSPANPHPSLEWPSCLKVVAAPDPAGLACLENAVAQALIAGDAPVEVLLVAPLNEPPDGLLDLAFWQRWLPLLQRLAELRCRVHWGLSQPETPMGSALGALARGWAREVGGQAGGLLWIDSTGPEDPIEQLESMWRAGPRAGDEWRWQAGSIEGLSWEPVDPELTPPEFHWPATKPSGTVLVTGGLGALGLATAAWLAQRGYRQLTLVSRRRPAADQQSQLAQLREQGIVVEVLQRDLSDPSEVERLLEELPQPLDGVVHAAGVLDDGLLNLQTPERCTAVSAAKATGGLLLEQFSRRHPDAFFVAYSSVAAVLGSPGQLAYGAANGFLDGLLRRRQQQGFVGLAVNWGPWAGEGMAAKTPQVLAKLDPQEALSALESVLARRDRTPAAVVLAHLEPRQSEHPSLPRLRELAKQLRGLEDEPALQAIEACLLDLLAELVGSDPDTFSHSTRLDELGLDSIMAVELASVVQTGLGVNLGLAALAGDPTVGSLAVHLQQLLRDPGGSNDPGTDLEEEARLPADLLSQMSGRQSWVGPGLAGIGLEQILLTGATGFLGAFLLADQLQRYPQLRVHCLVRAGSPDEALERVRRNLEHYGFWRQDYLERLVGLPGDLGLARLGLESRQWLTLANEVQGVLHNGAQLSYVAPYGQLRAPNVGGTLEVIKLAAVQGVPLEFVSSTSVYEAAAYRGMEIDEQADLAEWRGIHLGYSQTKWVSERLVWKAAQAGLTVRLYRPPLIAGHSRTGAWHQEDFLHRLVRGCLALGLAPSLDLALDLVPVDYVVGAIGALAWGPIRTPGNPDVLHLHHPEPVLWIDLLNGLVERGAPLKPTALDSWLEALAKQPDNPLYPLQPFFRHRWGAEQLTYAELNQPARKARPLCAHTLAALAPHGVTCPGFEELIGPYALTFLRSHG